MNRALLVGCVVVGLGIATPAHAVSIVLNGGFEEPDLGLGPSFSIQTSIPGWSSDSVPPPSGAGFEIQFGSVAGTPHGGDQLLELDGFFPSNIFQNLVTVPGAYYLVDFWFSPRPGAPAIENHIDFLWNGATVFTLLGNGTGLTDTSWTQYSFLVQATGISSRLEFRDLSPDDSPGGLGAYLDDVSAQAIPEPGGLLLLAGGLLALAGYARLRKS